MRVEKLKKRIYLNGKKTKWCQCIVFKNKIDMQNWYAATNPNDKNHYNCLGASLNYVKLKYGSKKADGECSTVILHFDRCGASIATHELLHAILYAHKHSFKKVQHPLCIKNMEEEEVILHNFSYAVNQFYNWYWKKVEPKFK